MPTPVLSCAALFAGCWLLLMDAGCYDVLLMAADCWWQLMTAAGCCDVLPIAAAGHDNGRHLCWLSLGCLGCIFCLRQCIQDLREVAWCPWRIGCNGHQRSSCLSRHLLHNLALFCQLIDCSCLCIADDGPGRWILDAFHSHASCANSHPEQAIHAAASGTDACAETDSGLGSESVSSECLHDNCEPLCNTMTHPLLHTLRKPYTVLLTTPLPQHNPIPFTCHLLSIPFMHHIHNIF